MTRLSFSVLGICTFTLAVIGGAGIGCGSSKSDDTKTIVVPRPDAATPTDNFPDGCDDENTCTGGASTTCKSLCGPHELGDSTCTCGADGTLTCTKCVLNVDYRNMVMADATEFCPVDGSGDVPRACTTPGAVCVHPNWSSRRGAYRREGCLCFTGKKDAQGNVTMNWDCTNPETDTPETPYGDFFTDHAPMNPPPPVDSGTTTTNPGTGGTTGGATDASAGN